MTTVVNDLLPYEAPVRLGAGGYICDIDIHSDGSMLAKPDTYGVYLWDTGLNKWRQLLKVTNMPSAKMNHATIERIFNCWVLSAVFAPSNSNIIYVDVAGYVIKSTDKGATWTLTNFALRSPAQAGNSGNRRLGGRRLAVDPINPDVVYRGYYDGQIEVSLDGGTTITTPATAGSATPAGQDNCGVNGIVIDSSSATVSGRKSRIMCMVYGVGPQESTDGGVTWTTRSTGSPPTNCTRAVMDSAGVYWVTDHINATNGSNLLWKYSGGTWTTQSPGIRAHGIAIYPSSNNRIAIMSIGGSVKVTTDGGSNWSSTLASNRSTSADIIWHTTLPSTFSIAHIVWDPAVADKLWLADGLSVCYATVASNQATTVQWIGKSDGIEQLVCSDIAKPPGSNQLFVACHDKDLFVKGNPDEFPFDNVFRAHHGQVLNTGFYIEHCHANPRFMMFTSISLSRYSPDGGLTWYPFQSAPWRRGATTTTNICSTTNLSSNVDIAITHGCNTSASSHFYITNTVTIGGLTLNGRYPCTYPNANTVRINVSPAAATSTVPSGGGSITYRLSYGDYISAGCRFMPGPQVMRYLPLTETNWIAEGGSGFGNFYTLDAGVTWAECPWPDSAPDSDFSALNALQPRRIIAADGATAGSAIALGANGVYKTTNGGATWTKVSASAVEGLSYYTNTVRGAPGVADTYFFTGGQVTGVTPGYPTNAFSITRDGGANWTRVADVLKVWTFDFGPVVAGGVPVLTIVGYVGGTSYSNWGIFQCRNWSNTDSSTWTWHKRGDYVNDDMDYCHSIAQDKEDADTIYLGYTGICAQYLSTQSFTDGPKTYHGRNAA